MKLAEKELGEQTILRSSGSALPVPSSTLSAECLQLPPASQQLELDDLQLVDALLDLRLHLRAAHRTILRQGNRAGLQCELSSLQLIDLRLNLRARQRRRGRTGHCRIGTESNIACRTSARGTR